MCRVDVNAFRALSDAAIIGQRLQVLLQEDLLSEALASRFRNEAEVWSRLAASEDRRVARAWLGIDSGTLMFLEMVLGYSDTEWSENLPALVDAARSVIIHETTDASAISAGLRFIRALWEVSEYDPDSALDDSPGAWRSKSTIWDSAPERMHALADVHDQLYNLMLANSGIYPAWESEHTAPSTDALSTDESFSRRIGDAAYSASNDSELVDQLKRAKEELFNLRFESATGRSESHDSLRAVKREIAALYTEIRSREEAVSAAQDDVGGKSTGHTNEEVLVTVSSDGHGGWVVTGKDGVGEDIQFKSQAAAVQAAWLKVRVNNLSRAEVIIKTNSGRVVKAKRPSRLEAGS
jgi:large subunit ribosomal protein L29